MFVYRPQGLKEITEKYNLKCFFFFFCIWFLQSVQHNEWLRINDIVDVVRRSLLTTLLHLKRNNYTLPFHRGFVSHESKHLTWWALDLDSQRSKLDFDIVLLNKFK